MKGTISERLRKRCSYGDARFSRPHDALANESADTIDALVEALEEMVYETTHLSPENGDGSHWCKISRNALQLSRVVLAKARKGG